MVLVSISFWVYSSPYTIPQGRALEWWILADHPKESNHKFVPKDPITSRFCLEQRLDALTIATLYEIKTSAKEQF